MKKGDKVDIIKKEMSVWKEINPEPIIKINERTAILLGFIHFNKIGSGIKLISFSIAI